MPAYMCVYMCGYKGVNTPRELCAQALLQRISGSPGAAACSFSSCLLPWCGSEGCWKATAKYVLINCPCGKKCDEKWPNFCLSLNGGRGEGKLIPSPFKLSGLVTPEPLLRNAERDLNLQ